MEARLEHLRAICDRLAEELDADGCLLSRMVGDVLILVAEDAKLRSTRIGRGYMVSDFPTTQRVLRDRTAVALTVDDEDADQAEVTILRELGFWSLLMLPLEVAGEVWGLLELYGGQGRVFTDDDAARAHALARI